MLWLWSQIQGTRRLCMEVQRGWAIPNSDCTHFEFDRINYTILETLRA